MSRTTFASRGRLLFFLLLLCLRLRLRLLRFLLVVPLVPRRGLPVALLLGFALLACSPPSPPSGQAGREIPARTEILWDEWGVPHIFARTSEELFYAHGQAQAEAHGNLLLHLFGRARGRAAEYWGDDELASDRWVRTVGIPARAEAWYRAQPADQRACLDAFAAGINAYAAAHPEALDDAAERVLPATATDVLAHLQRVIHFTFVVNAGEVAGAARGLGETGSNAWAISPSHSENGHAMLVANPHLPWGDLFTWFEVQLTSPDLDAYGVTLLGTPFLGIAFNDHLGWTHTVNTHDGADLYELTLAGDGYRYDSGVRPFEVEEEVIEVRREDGSLGEEPLTIRRSVHGPVVAEHGGKALALRTVGLDAPGMMEQYWEMMRATDLPSFEAAEARLQMPMFTTIYADADGHILHLFGGQTPKRPAGDWNWAGVVPGDTSATLWTETHPYADLPRVVDPPGGWLQNANDPPWTTTFPEVLDPGSFPPYMAPHFMHFRAQSSARLLAEDDRFTYDELVAAKHSTRMEVAERLLDDLGRAVEASGSEAAHRAWEVLAAWDHRADAGSRGAVLFARFFEALMGSSGGDPFATDWSETAPRTTPDGLADPAAAVAVLEGAAREVEAEYGALDVPWGDVYRLRVGEHDLPANGGPGSLGIFRVLSFRPAGSGQYAAVGGDSYVAVIEFGDRPRARALLSYGNWSQPGSPHVGDQLELFAKQELRPVWRERGDVEAHLEAREELLPPGGETSGGGPP